MLLDVVRCFFDVVKGFGAASSLLPYLSLVNNPCDVLK